MFSVLGFLCTSNIHGYLNLFVGQSELKDHVLSSLSESKQCSAPHTYQKRKIPWCSPDETKETIKKRRLLSDSESDSDSNDDIIKLYTIQENSKQADSNGSLLRALEDF